MEGRECLGVESPLSQESIQENVGGAGREGGAGGQAVVGREGYEGADTQGDQRRDGGEMTHSWGGRRRQRWMVNL